MAHAALVVYEAPAVHLTLDDGCDFHGHLKKLGNSGARR